MVGARGQVRRVAMLSVHTSPLDQPGSGDAGGMNVYIVEVARRLAERGVEVEVFTRATSATSPPSIQLAPGVLVRHVNAGPYEGLGKSDLPGQLCAFTAGVMAAVASAPERWYDVVHSHYWLSGQVGWLAADRWRVPLVHTMHTMARVKNAGRSALESAEPGLREIGEEQVVQAADLLVANTEAEATDLVRLYHADPERVRVVWPGVDLDVFTPGDQATAREQLRLPQDAELVLFVGRLQAHKAPDLLLRAVAELVARRPASRIQLAVLGGQSGTASYSPRTLHRLAAELGIDDRVHLGPPQTRADLVRWYRAADLVAVPSRTESFGLVAAEAQACGTPVVAGRVGGLPTVVADSGVLVPGHEPARWAEAIDGLLRDGLRRDLLSRKAIARARGFGWDRTADRLLGVYQEAAGRRAAVDQRVAG